MVLSSPRGHIPLVMHSRSKDATEVASVYGQIRCNIDVVISEFIKMFFNNQRSASDIWNQQCCGDEDSVDACWCDIKAVGSPVGEEGREWGGVRRVWVRSSDPVWDYKTVPRTQTPTLPYPPPCPTLPALPCSTLPLTARQ